MEAKYAIPIFEECVQRLDSLEVLMTRSRERLENKSLQQIFLNFEERARWEQDADRQYAKKLEQTRDFIEQMLRKAIEEFQTKCTFESLGEAVQQQLIKKYKVPNAIKEENEQKENIREMKEKLQKASSEMNVQISEKEKEIAEYKKQLQKIRMYSRKMNELIDKTTQNKLLMTQKELEQLIKELTEEIKKLNMENNIEIKAHEETVIFLNKMLKEFETQIKHWESKYCTDISELEEKLQKLRQEKFENLNNIEELAERLEIMTAVIEEDRIEKETLQLQKEREEKENWAATKIQAWWKGIMVRKGLGPYRKKKGKKGATKKKKK